MAERCNKDGKASVGHKYRASFAGIIFLPLITNVSPLTFRIYCRFNTALALGPIKITIATIPFVNPPTILTVTDFRNKSLGRGKKSFKVEWLRNVINNGATSDTGRVMGGAKN